MPDPADLYGRVESEGLQHGPEAGLVEEARQHLRAGHARHAVEIVERCVRTRGDDEWLQEIRTYAYERLRAKRGSSTSLDQAALQRVLAWLTREELAAGDRAFREGKVSAAIEAYEKAARIDDRGTRVALMHARTLLGYVRAALAHQPPPDPDKARACLVDADRLARQAAHDPALRARALQVAHDVDALLHEVDEAGTRDAKQRAINEVLRRFNSYVDYYNRDPPRFMVQRANARSSLAQIRTQVANLRREHPPDSPEGRMLADIAKRVEIMQTKYR